MHQWTNHADEARVPLREAALDYPLEFIDCGMGCTARRGRQRPEPDQA